MSDNLKPTVSVEMPDTLKPTVSAKYQTLSSQLCFQKCQNFSRIISLNIVLVQKKFTRDLLLMSGISTGFTTGQRLHD